MDDGTLPTLSPAPATLHAPIAELPGPQLEELVRTDRYDPGSVIGKGGMGEIRQCRDVRLNRHIALKTATTKNRAELSRFVREAQVQGQLEHPSIVPVYELGVGADGAPYFAMKRVHGVSLYDVIIGLSQGSAELAQRFPRRRLLSAFLSVCQAVDYAHVNGWLHRDLKPANIMLGDFGEVYVLDWGLARRIDARDDEHLEGPIETRPMGLTTPGSLMGTPGYMSPEQVIGQRADPRSDVYALGAILFELLTHEMLATGKSTMELLINTRDGVDARARLRAPHADVAPELEVIIMRAAARERAERFATVRELHDAVDRVLAGERDNELRSDLARKHAETAREAEARSRREGADELEHRKTALREVGLALALDPSNRPAVSMLLELLKSPPKTTPVEARAEIEATESASVRSGSRTAGHAFVFVGLLYGAFSVLTGSGYCALSAGVFLAAGLSSLRAGYAVARPKSLHALPALLLSNLAIMTIFFVDGPLTILPAFSAVNTLAFRISLGRRWGGLVTGLGLFTVAAPLVASMLGWLPQSFRYVNEGLLLLPIAIPFSPTHTTMMLVCGFIGTIAIASLVVGRVRNANFELARLRAMQSWNLQQLLPPEAAPKAEPAGEGELCPIGEVKAALHGT
ncbi:MAG: serine/threonine protein kinase [Archangiaceae bacterium]|nr:serine/threonine protein kinase [Archangiaceae bacterium]